MEQLPQATGYLQYGALGILAMFMVGFGLWMRQVMMRSQQFIEEVARDAMSSQREHTKAWQAMTERSISAEEKMATCIEAIGERATRDHAARHEEHRTQTEKLDKLLNGQRAESKS